MFETKMNMDQLKMDPPPCYEDVEKEACGVRQEMQKSTRPTDNTVTTTSPRTMQLRILEHFDKKMTKCLLLLSLACMALVIVSSSPVLHSKEGGETGRQVSDATVAQVAAAAVPIDAPAVPSGPAAATQAAPPVTTEEDEDDDDDDDDDDVGIDDIADDDDDDDDDEENEATSEDEEDDDDEEDYFERFFDDILGEDDDDDDDDSKPASSTAKPAAQAAQSVDYVGAEYPASGTGGGASTGEQTEDPVYPDDPVDPHTVTLLSSPPEADLAAAAGNSAAALSSNALADGTADGTVSDEADDDDDEEEDEDEDDDESDVGSKRSRALHSNPVGVPQTYIYKYNRFVDSILNRVNKVLKKHYDPVNVRLADAPQQKKAPPPPAKRPAPHHQDEDDFKSDKMENRLAEFALVSSSKNTSRSEQASSEEAVTSLPTDEPVTRKHKNKSKAGKKHKSGRSHRARNLHAKRNGKKKSPARPKNPPKAKSHPRAKATLLGLSTLRRDGDVTVNVMSAHTTVKAKFFVGPLMLKVEKEFGRGVKKELRSATATTAEMMGKINLRIMHGGQATLHSIRVLQPKQVRVDSPDEHDSTREFLWKRSSHIAHLVTERLTSAARSLLQPRPSQEPHVPLPPAPPARYPVDEDDSGEEEADSS